MASQNAIMVGAPPAPDAQVTLANWRDWPYSRWAFHHVSQIVPCAMIWRGAPSPAWPEAAQDIRDITFGWQGDTLSVGDMLKHSTTDGFVVLHQGRLVHEFYDAGLKPHAPHILFSVSKAVAGLVAGALVERGQLEPDDPIASHLPELAGCAYGDAAVRDLLDMTVGLDFEEDYEAAEGDMVAYRENTGWSTTGEAPMGMRKYLATLARKGDHGQVFKYASPNTDLLGWVLERVSGRAYADLVSETLWAPLGAEQDAYIGVDPFGAARASGGLCATVRDLARVGQMVLEGGRANGAQVVPEHWIKDLYAGGSQDAWSAGSFAQEMPDNWYRSHWYKYGPDARAISGIGIYGQMLWVHPASGTVVAKVSSRQKPLDFTLDAMQAAAFESIAAALG